MDPTPSPDADGVERTLDAARRIAVPVAAALLVLVAVAAGGAAEEEAAARSGTTRTVATVVGTPAGDGASVRVGWIDTRGEVRSGVVPVSGEVRPGHSVSIWLGPDGAPGIPPGMTEVRTAGLVRAAWVAVVGGLFLLLAHRSVRRAGRVRAARRLDREWRDTELRWREHPAG